MYYNKTYRTSYVHVLQHTEQTISQLQHIATERVLLMLNY